MMDWDDLKIFLAVARLGSVRGAATTLKINQSTVSRRINAFEKTIGATLFEKHPSGYVTTMAGEEIRASVERIEKEVFSIDRMLFKRQAELEGPLKVTLPVVLSTGMLMPEFARFSKQYPLIKLIVNVSSQLTNLSKREADIAIRIIKIGDSPPPYLVGRKLVTYASANYVSRERVNHDNLWITNDETTTQPQWLKDSDFPDVAIGHSVDDLTSLIAAVKAGMGMAYLPCYYGDTDDSLIRVPNSTVLPGREIWLLTHIDLKNTPKVKVFMDCIREFFEQNKTLLEGKLAVSANKTNKVS